MYIDFYCFSFEYKLIPMKYLSLAFLMVTFVSLNAQLPIKLKYDEAKYAVDSSFVILKSGSKYAAFDLTKDAFAIPFGKSKLFLFENSNVFAKIDFKTNELSLQYISKKGNLAITGNSTHAFLGTAFPFSGDGLVDANGQLTYLYEGEPPYGFPDPPYDWAKQEMNWIQDQIYIINNYRNNLPEYGYVNNDAPSVIGVIEGYQKSGVYDFEKNTWLIEPKYQECKRIKNTIVCSYAADEDKNSSYDYYIIDANQNIVLLGEKANQLKEDLLKLWFGIETELFSYENGYCVYKIQEKMGLIYFNLTNELGSSINKIYFDELLNCEFNFIAYSNFMNALLSFTKSPDTKYSLFVPIESATEIDLKKLGESNNEIEVFYEWQLFEEHNGLSVKINNETLIYQNGNEPVYEPYMVNSSSKFSLFIINDFAIVNDYHFGIFENNLITTEGEDSIFINEEGNLEIVSEYEIEPEGKSYIYHLSGDKLATDKIYHSIAGGASGFILQEYYKKGNEYKSNFLLMDLMGEQIQNMLSPDDIISNDNYLIFGYQGESADTIFIAPNGFYGHLQYRNTDYYGPFYIQGNGKIGLYVPDANLKNQYTNEMYEFIHYHPQLEVTFFLKNDSIWMYSMYDTLAVSKYGQIIYMQEDYYYDPSQHYFIATTDNGETKFYGAEMSRANSYTRLSIQMVGDKLIINDTGFDQTDLCIECFNDYGEFISSREIKMQPENSSVWEKTEKGWQKISSYYAEVILSSDSSHYIVRSGSYFDVINEELVINRIESKYFFLDSNMLAISVGDYFSFSEIEDLGFGLKVQFNAGEKYFFMTYDGKAITNADWDNFEIENGKLKAILETQYEIDLETGEIIYDEYGQPVEVVSQTVSYFNLPR